MTGQVSAISVAIDANSQLLALETRTFPCFLEGLRIVQFCRDSSLVGRRRELHRANLCVYTTEALASCSRVSGDTEAMIGITFDVQAATLRWSTRLQVVSILPRGAAAICSSEDANILPRGRPD
jgi:hypothetical protein